MIQVRRARKTKRKTVGGVHASGASQEKIWRGSRHASADPKHMSSRASLRHHRHHSDRPRHAFLDVIARQSAPLPPPMPARFLAGTYARSPRRPPVGEARHEIEASWRRHGSRRSSSRSEDAARAAMDMGDGRNATTSRSKQICRDCSRENRGVTAPVKMSTPPLVMHPKT